MQDINECIDVLNARREGREIEAMDLKPPPGSNDWQRVTPDHAFNFQKYRYRVVVFPEVTYGIFSIDSRQMHKKTFNNPAIAAQSASELNGLQTNKERWVMVRVLECGQVDELRARAPRPGEIQIVEGQ